LVLLSNSARPSSCRDLCPKRFRKKLLRIVTLFRDAEGKLFPLAAGVLPSIQTKPLCTCSTVERSP